MKSVRNFSLEDGGANRGTRMGSPIKMVRVADPEKKRASWRAPTNPREVKTSNVINLPEPKRKVPGVVPASKSRLSPPEKTKDNNVSSSIKKLSSEYEAPGKVRKPDDARYKPMVKPISTKPAEGQTPSKYSSRAYDKNGRRRNIATPTTKTIEVKLQQVKSGKGEEYQARKPVRRKKTVPEERKMKTVEEEVIKTSPVDYKVGERVCEELVPILSPVREENNPVSIISSFISDYLEEERDNRSGSKAKMDFPLPSLEEGIGNVFPVRSKRAMDNIPNCNLPEALSPDNSEFIIMLRRRNSEPYSQKSCVLYGGDPDRSSPPLPVGMSRDTLENYLFWEPGPAHLNKPYWEVSLFKSNRSLSVVNTTTSTGHPLAPIERKSSLIVHGHFNKSISETIPEVSEPPPAGEFKPCLPDVRYCKAREGTIRALSFATLMERGKGIPNELGFRRNAGEEERYRRKPSRVISKDDNYKPPANLLVYVKSSKKLVALDGSESNYENLINKKLHKITKIRGVESEARPTFRQKSVILAVASALLLTTGIIFLFQILMKRPAYFNLTPPIPGLVRGC